MASRNPAAGPVVVRVALPELAQIELIMYDVRGRAVRTLARGLFAPGEHPVTWDGHDDRGSLLANGVYYARLRVDGGAGVEHQTEKVMVLR